MTIGSHLILDLYGCDPEDVTLLSSQRGLEATLGSAARKAGATVRSYHSHPFRCDKSGGTSWSIMVILEESHISSHVWLHERFISLDLYTCGDKTDPMKALDYLTSVFRPKDTQMTVLKRGNKNVA